MLGCLTPDSIELTTILNSLKSKYSIMSSEKWIKEHPKEIREYKLNWYKRNKVNELARLKNYRQNNIRWFKKYKKNLKCMNCQESDSRCLEFHHKNPKTKKSAVCTLVSQGYSIKNILKEINKCEVLCANCHRKITIK